VPKEAIQVFCQVAMAASQLFPGSVLFSFGQATQLDLALRINDRSILALGHLHGEPPTADHQMRKTLW